ncbi:GntR family transcriptional regulator [Streptomyces sp. NPDC048282]|uniref:GntR family transcriptional regulator n=1 Tax=Streptomyces sp. NPDC048282 TaxID=3365528 RepID=UPI003720D82B
MDQSCSVLVVSKGNVVVDPGRRASPQAIADILRQRIRVGDLKRGDRLPTQAKLAEEFGVERSAVRRALRLLEKDGLLSHVGKGSPPRIAQPSTPRAEPPQSTMVGLSPRLVEALAASHVRIDVVSHTTETLMLALGKPLQLIHARKIRPERIDVRILLPSRDINLAFPVSVTGGGDGDPVHRRWLSMRNSQVLVLRNHLQNLRSHGIDVSVMFRALPFTPPVKMYLLNGEEVLFGYYMLTRRGEEFERRRLDMYDALGSASILFSFTKHAGARDATFVEETQKWFDALWGTITRDLSLS